MCSSSTWTPASWRACYSARGQRAAGGHWALRAEARGRGEGRRTPEVACQAQPPCPGPVSWAEALWRGHLAPTWQPHPWGLLAHRRSAPRKCLVSWSRATLPLPSGQEHKPSSGPAATSPPWQGLCSPHLITPGPCSLPSLPRPCPFPQVSQPKSLPAVPCGCSSLSSSPQAPARAWQASPNQSPLGGGAGLGERGESIFLHVAINSAPLNYSAPQPACV